ncbi:MAG TPA: N-6 DNA methylase, partial [bacterium]|nr:N-6 DNA methylase [bacterium]
KISKMKQRTELGSRIAQVHNGSSLFTGDAGQGESNIRRWIIENDWLEAIIALPENMFYNTGISTYIWVLSNRKTKERKGKVQLIDASALFTPLRKNLGKKNCEFSDEQINMICDLILKPKQTEISKIFQNEAFGYHKITVERPLRLAVNFDSESIAAFKKACLEADEKQLIALLEKMGTVPIFDYNEFQKKLEATAETMNLKLNTKRLKLVQNNLAVVDETAAPVIKKIIKSGKMNINPLYGVYETVIDKKKFIVEYEPDTNLRDTEQVPLLEDGGIEAFFKREVLPYAPDAWIDETKTQVGYEISFTRYFYKPAQMRTLDEITADIKALEKETDGLLNEIIGN